MDMKVEKEDEKDREKYRNLCNYKASVMSTAQSSLEQTLFEHAGTSTLNRTHISLHILTNMQLTLNREHVVFTSGENIYLCIALRFRIEILNLHISSLCCFHRAIFFWWYCYFYLL